jgi:GGDEF domain-containing protein
LTGVANRRAILAALDEAVAAPDRPVAVLFVDLDGFKQVNDVLGHAAVTPSCTRWGCACVTRCDRPTWWDASAVTISPSSFATARPATALDVGLRVESAIAAPFRVGSYECLVTASVGSARSGRDGYTSDALLAAADAGMYAAKSARMPREVVRRLTTGPDAPATS